MKLLKKFAAVVGMGQVLSDYIKKAVHLHLLSAAPAGVPQEEVLATCTPFLQVFGSEDLGVQHCYGH